MKYSLKSCYCSLFSLLVCIGLLRPAHTPKVKYSLSKLLLWLALSARIQWPFRTSTPSQREIFSLTAVIVACSLCSYTVAFQDQHTLPKRNILSKLLLWLALCICISGPAHPPKVKYSLSKLLLWLALSAHIQWPFRTSTPSQREIFSQSCYCGLLCVFAFQDQHTLPKRNILSKLLLWLCSYGVSFQDQHTLPKRNILSKLLLWLALCICISGPAQREYSLRNILSHSCYCDLLSLLIYSGLSGPAHPPKEKYSLKAVIVACSVYLHFRTSTPSQREIVYSLKAVIVACSYGVSFQDQHTLPKRNILSKLLLWLALCICISGPAHPPKVKYSLSQLLL